MTRLLRLLTALGLTAPSAGAQVPTVDSITKLLKYTTFAFQGTVLQRQAVSDPVLEASRWTYVVRATSVLQCPREVGEFSGQRLTVFNFPDASLAVGTRAWFFATAWVIGEGIAVFAPAAFPTLTIAQSNQLTSNFDQAVWGSYLTLLWARADSANLIAVGRVTSIAPVARKANFQGEHISVWYALGVQIDSVVKGDSIHRGRATQVLVPASLILGDAAITLTVGDQRVFLVENAARNPDLTGLVTSARFFAQDSIGVRPLSELKSMIDQRVGIPGRPPVVRCSASQR